MHVSRADMSTSSKYFSPDAEKLVFAERSEFGRKIMKAVLSIVREICISQDVLLTVSKLKRLAISPVSL